ncbi:MAG: phosphoenolpyruvate synthase [Desulfocapsaceae bacterium]|jgi:pyruvate,water dikinase|nr:phosphoenolpyruvate synthase [Desulfocapsaceae bacterium]
MKNEYIAWFDDLSAKDTALVGGKNSSLGEMVSVLSERGVRVPHGFATTTAAYHLYIDENGFREKLDDLLDRLESKKLSLEKAGTAIRKLFLDGEFPLEVENALTDAYRNLSKRYRGSDQNDHEGVDVAVRSSATAEDLPEASFAGQQETFLNISDEKQLLDACRKCFASLFTDRALSYRREKQFPHDKVALSVGVQKMVRADKACSGVMFSIDTETGFPDVVLIDAVWGLGENIVQGTVNPDEYRVFKPLLKQKELIPIIEKRRGSKEKTMVYAQGGSATVKNKNTPRKKREQFTLDDEDILQLARWACTIEEHYGTPMDMEWAKDGDSGDLFIVQARPETVQSQKQKSSFTRYRLKGRGEILLSGLAVGDAIAAGKAHVLHDLEEMKDFEKGDVLVTEMTDPDWGPIMKQAAAIITEHGGRTSHAAIVSRELGIPAVVGAEGAISKLQGASEVTVSCAEGEMGNVYEGILEFDEEKIDLEEIPDIDTSILINIASPEAALRWWRLPVDGIGLARMEFIINSIIKIHPMALIETEKVESKKVRREIEQLTQGFESGEDYFVDHLARGIAAIAASQYPKEVIVRMSDLKTNEYAHLIGGEYFEPEEENPMLGFRGASRYYSKRYRPAFDLECRAVRRARETFGFDNVLVMIPFCRTLEEADKVLAVLAENGLERGRKGLQVYVMSEIPANVILAAEFADRFDGFSIGSNDLTQLVLGVDRDLGELAGLFDERNEAVKQMIEQLIATAHEKGKKVGICGQGPSDYPDFAEFLVGAGIDSISLNPDSVISVKQQLANVEQKKRK